MKNDWIKLTQLKCVTCETRCGVTQRILTVRGWLSLFRPYSTVAATNRKWCFKAVPHVAVEICRWIATGRVWFSRVRPLSTSGTAPDDHFLSADTVVENAWNRLSIRLSVGIHRKTALHALETARKRHLQLTEDSLRTPR